MAIEITIENVTKRFGDITALDDLSLTIKAGEFFTLLGPSGSGKSTLLRQLSGFDVPDTGRILFDGKDVTNVSANHRPSATVFQDLALFPHMNVAQNVGYGLRIKGNSPAEVKRKVTETLNLVGLDDFEGRDVNKLSGGQQQRVALARSLVMEPGVILLDEPLTGLDENLRQQMRDEFGRLHKRTGATFILVTHNQDEALSLSDRMAILRDGQIEQLGTPKQFFKNPTNSFVGRFMGMECVVRPEKVDKEKGGYLAAIGGISLPAFVPGGETPGADCILAFRPDQIALAPSDANAYDTINLKVSAVRYRGLYIDIHAVFPDGQEVVIAHKADSDIPLPALEEEIPVVFSLGAPLILADK